MAMNTLFQTKLLCELLLHLAHPSTIVVSITLFVSNQVHPSLTRKIEIEFVTFYHVVVLL